MSHNFGDEHLSNAKFYMLAAFVIALLGLGVIQLTQYEVAGRYIALTAIGPIFMFLYEIMKVFKSGLDSKNSDDQPNKKS